MEYYCDKYRHLVCVPYTYKNLHLMAKDLGLGKMWYHNSNGKRHYDIPRDPVRRAEIEAKCKMVSTREIIKIIKHQN